MQLQRIQKCPWKYWVLRKRIGRTETKGQRVNKPCGEVWEQKRWASDHMPALRYAVQYVVASSSVLQAHFQEVLGQVKSVWRAAGPASASASMFESLAPDTCRQGVKKITEPQK